MDLITGDTNNYMTVHVFEEIFKNVLFPLFSETDLNKFIDCADDAFKSWKVKFVQDHKMVQKLDLADRIDQYSFEKRSLLAEIYRQFTSKYMTDGVMDFK